MQTARARTLIRVFDLRGAFDELHRLVRSTSAPSQELELSLGQVATLTSDVDVAEAELQHVLANPSLTVVRRVRALGSLAVTRVLQGRGAEARQFIEDIVDVIDDPLLACHALLVRAFITWVDEQDTTGDGYYERTQALLRHAPTSYRSRIVAPVMWVGTLAREGRFTEAAEHLRRAEEGIGTEELLMRVQLRAVYGSFLAERGDRLEALAEWVALSRALEHSGYRAGHLWADALIARLQFTLGQRHAARRLMEDTIQRAESVGNFGGARIARLASQHDPVWQVQHLDERPPHQEKRGYQARWHALWALRSAASGQADRTRAHRAAADRLAVGPGYSVDRAIAHLADATLARLEGRSADTVAALEKAEREIAAEGADATLLLGLADAVGHVRVVTPTLRRIVVEPELDFGRYDVVLDGREHHLRLPSDVIDLKTRPVLRRLLYILASHPGRVFTKEELTQQIWAGTYSLLVHDNALKVNIARLRKLLSSTPLQVEFEESGYSLQAPDRFMFIAVDSV